MRFIHESNPDDAGKIVRQRSNVHPRRGRSFAFKMMQGSGIGQIENVSGIRILVFVPSWFLVKCRHRYAVSFLMDTAYRMSEQKGLQRQKGTKRSKNDQKPTRNERDKSKSEESAKDHSRISPTQQAMKSKPQLKSKDQE
ncbi:hypothetical protein Tco_0707231 [Tanacetum coccineum]|uniref:Uncharacterized protein n=1 Tax=Tanacetum coccineum TaxID=301880 RepID=A0ABQ4YAG9_9ASTR